MVPNAAMLAPKTRPGGVPHRLLEIILEIFEVRGGLGRFGRMLRAALHGSGRSGGALERFLLGLRRRGGGSWRGFGCHVGAQDGSEIHKILKKVWLQEAGGSAVDFGFGVQEKQPTSSKICFFSRGILMSNAYSRFQHRHRIVFVLGANMASC